MKIDLSDLEIKINERPALGMDSSLAARTEELVFSASYKGKKVGKVVTDIYTQSTQEEQLDEYFFDQTVQPPQPRARLFLISVEPTYQRNGVASHLLEQAAHYHKEQHQTLLYSSTGNSDEAKKLWNDLEKKNKARRCDYRGEPRWCFL